MDFLQDIKKQTLIIADNNTKSKILNYISNLDKFVNIKIMNIDEFFNHYFFSYDEKTIYYLKNKYHLTIEIANIYLNNLKYIINADINDKKILFQKQIYKDLKENNYLKEDIIFKKYLETIDIIVLNKNYLDKFSIDIFNKYNAKYINLISNNYNHDIIYHFNDIEDECSFVFNKISELLKYGIDYSNIKIISLGNEYLNYLKRFSYLYKIALNNLEKNSIYATIETKNILNLIKENKSKDQIFNYLTKLNKDLSKLYIDIINKYYFIDNLNDVIDFIEDDLKNTYFKEENNINGIDVIELDSNLITEKDYVFMLGFNLENIPKNYKDIEYLNDSLKKEIGLLTSLEKNKLEKEKIINNINSINNLFISYKEKDPYTTYFRSNLVEDLNLKEEEINMINTSSNLYNKIKLTNEFDLMLKYGTTFNDTSLLYNTYKDIPYLKYSNIWNGLSNFKLDKIVLSYTSINNYYHCSFKYYIDNILKLNIYEETFKIFIGNLFHYVLSKMYNENFDFELEWNNYLKDKDFNKKEIFYLTMLKDELKNIIKVLKYHYQITGLTNLKLEEEITINYQDNYYFNGRIDKIMFKEKEGNTYISLIDYKTGIPKTDFSNLQYGIDMQLPVYVYLISKSNLFINPKIIGFYLEQILHENNTYDSKRSVQEQKRDNLKLIGYSINDPYLVSMFDGTYENSEMIRGMKTTSKGFSHWTKVFNEDEIDKLINIVDEKIKEAFSNIKEGNFNINPKVINGENLGCSFCKYQDLCFKTGNDLVYLEKDND